MDSAYDELPDKTALKVIRVGLRTALYPHQFKVPCRVLSRKLLPPRGKRTLTRYYGVLSTSVAQVDRQREREMY